MAGNRDTTSTYFELDDPDEPVTRDEHGHPVPDQDDGKDGKDGAGDAAGDAGGFRAYGKSKDSRDDLPQIVIGMAVTRDGILLELLDVLGLPRVHLVGNSMGGIIALRMVLDAPERVDRLVLMGSGGAPVAPLPDLLRMIRFYEDPTEAAMRELLPRFVHDPTLLAGRLEEIISTRLAMASRPGVRRSHLATFDPGHEPVRYTPEQLAGIAQETLVVHGREDRFLPVQASYFFAEHIRNAQLHVLPNTGHWAQLEQPKRFSAQVELFLTEPSPAGQGR